MSTTWVPAPPSADTFGSRLRLLRLALDDATIEQVARRCGIPAPTWRTWERGASPHQLARVIEQIHEATGVAREWLMWGGDPDRFRSGAGEAAAGPGPAVDSATRRLLLESAGQAAA